MKTKLVETQDNFDWNSFKQNLLEVKAMIHELRFDYSLRAYENQQEAIKPLIERWNKENQLLEEMYKEIVEDGRPN